MALRDVKISTSIKTADGAAKSAPGTAYWMSVSAGATGGTIQLNDSTADGGTDRFDVSMPANSVAFFLFDPPIEFGTGIFIDIPGTNITATLGYN